MSKKTNKNEITIGSIFAAIEEPSAPYETIEIGEGKNAVSIRVKKYLSLLEYGNMIKDIVDMVFLGSEENVIYAPYTKEFAIGFNILTHYTNISLPNDSEKVWRFFKETSILEKVYGHISDYVDIYISVEGLIEYRKEEILKRSKLDGLVDGVSSILKGIGEKLRDIDIEKLLEGVEKDRALPSYDKIIESIKTEIGKG